MYRFEILDIYGRGRLVNALRRNGSGVPQFRQSYAYDAGDNMLTKKTVPMSTALVDDFSDGNCTSNPVWTPDAGTWSVIGDDLYAQNTVSATAPALRTSVTNADGDYWFSYCIVDASVTAARARLLFRSSYPTTVTFMFTVFYADYMMLRQFVNSADTTLYTNNSVTSTSGTWYDVYIKAEGAHVEVWRGLKGQALDKIAETNSATVLTGGQITMDTVANAQVRYDNVRYAQALSTNRSFVDAFTDQNYNDNPTWTVSGTWSAAAQYMANTADPSYYRYFKKSVAFDSAVIRFSYYKVNTNQASFEWQVSSSLRMVLFIEASQMRLRQWNGSVWTNLDINTSAVSQTDQWYDMQVVMDGSRVEVWWGTQGSSLQRILSTTSNQVTNATSVVFMSSPNGLVRFDNIIVTADEPSTTTYQYNNANEMTTMATGGVSTTFTYDAWGRTVTKTQGSYQARYNYSFGDKVKDITSNFPGEAATVYYNYDGLGKRRNKTLDLATATWWRWDLGYNVIQEYTDPDADWDIENLAATFVPGLAEIPGGDPSTGSYRYYMTDHLGSVRTIRDQNKASLASYEFMPYGETYLQSGLALNHGFTFECYDKDTGFYYFSFRYYSPHSSRWLSRDPVGKATTSRYAYVKCSPTQYFDALGMTAVPVFKWGKDNPKNDYCGSKHGINVPDNFFIDKTSVSFTSCCKPHDDCYGCKGKDEKKSKADCDKEFGECMKKTCERIFPEGDKRKMCNEVADWFYVGVAVAGDPAFDAWRKCCP